MKKVLVVILAGLLCIGTAQGCKKAATTTLSDAGNRYFSDGYYASAS